jgi:hypothetical protein
MFRAEGRVQIVFGDNRALRVNYCDFCRRGVAAFETRPVALDEGPAAYAAIVAPTMLTDR